MSNPIFPDEMARREVELPGARAHKAGLDPVRRLAALEEGAAARHTFQVISERAGRVTSGMGTSGFGIGFNGLLYFGGTAGAPQTLVYIDPAVWGSRGVAVKFRSWCSTEAAPTSSTLTTTLFRVTATNSSGHLASATQVPGIDTAVTVSAAGTFYTPGESETVTLTTAGFYIVNMTHSANPAVGMSYGYTLMGRPA